MTAHVQLLRIVYNRVSPFAEERIWGATMTQQDSAYQYLGKGRKAIDGMENAIREAFMLTRQAGSTPEL